MFITTSQFKQYMPRGLIGPDETYWRAVTLSLEKPWFLFVYEVECEGRRVPQTMLVAWESALLDTLAVVPKAYRRAVGRLEKSRDKRAHWDLRWIQSIWAATCDEANEVGSVIFQFEDDLQLFDAHLQPVPRNSARELLFGV